MHSGASANYPLPETRDTEPPSCLPELELPSPRASRLRVPEVAALPDLTLASLLRLLAHVSQPGNGFDFTHYTGEGLAPWHGVTLFTRFGDDLRSFSGSGTPDEAVRGAFDGLERALLRFPGGNVDVSGFRANDAPTQTTLTEDSL